MLKEMVSPDEKVIGYFLTKPCVVKLIPKDNQRMKVNKRDININVSMDASCKRKDIPLPTDWVVTMVTPIEKVEQMYKEYFKCKTLQRGNFKWKNHR